MDESTRIIVAYASLLLGLPLLAARILWFVPGAVAALILSAIAGGLDRFVGAAVEGFLSLFLACLLFNRLGIAVAWKIPAILAAVTFLWSCTKADHHEAFPAIMGIIAGFLLYPQAWLYLCMKLGVDV